MIVKTFRTVFPHTTLWFTPGRLYYILVGTQEKLEIAFKSLSSKLEMRNIQQELEELNVTDPFDFLGYFALGEEALTKYVGDAKINTDDHPYLEFTPSMAVFREREYVRQNQLSISKFRESVFPLLVNTGETDEEIATVAEKVQKRFEATQYGIRGELLAIQGMLEQAVVEFRQALLIDPEDKLDKSFLEIAEFNLKQVYFNRGFKYYDNGIDSKAINEFEKAIDIDPNFVAAHYYLAISYINEAMYEEAKVELTKVLELDPQDEETRHLLKMLEESGF